MSQQFTLIIFYLAKVISSSFVVDRPFHYLHPQSQSESKLIKHKSKSGKGIRKVINRRKQRRLHVIAIRTTSLSHISKPGASERTESLLDTARHDNESHHPRRIDVDVDCNLFVSSSSSHAIVSVHSSPQFIQMKVQQELHDWRRRNLTVDLKFGWRQRIGG